MPRKRSIAPPRPDSATTGGVTGGAIGGTIGNATGGGFTGGETCEVVPFDAGGRAYTYAVPFALRGKIRPGQLVRVPLGRDTRLGVVWDKPTTDTAGATAATAAVPAPAAPAPADDLFPETIAPPRPAAPRRLKPLLQLCGETPVLSPDLPALARWLASYYAAPLNSVLETVLPAAVRNGVRPTVARRLALVRRLDDDALAKLRRRAPKQAALHDFLAAQLAPVERGSALKGLNIGAAACDALIAAGVVAETSDAVRREAYADDLAEAEVVASAPPALNAQQQAALDAAAADIASRRFAPRLLLGVTGSGKTEVYIGAIQRALDAGGGAIFLVPEVALTPQTVGRLRARLGACVVWHSHLSAGERHDAWLALARGEARLVVGARSAVFAPVPALRLIVVDEEHEPSYKQGETPLYHGRDAAVARARLNNAAVILGSATPSLETYANALSGKYAMSRLDARVDDRAPPAFRIVDMRRESLRGGPAGVLSRDLAEALRERLERREQSILFLNRRGFSRQVVCPECGFVAGCPHCSLALTLHRTDNTLRCHGCGHTEPAPASCPQCFSPKILGRGTGTQRLEDVLRALLPTARLMRLDADTMQRKNLFREVLGDFRRGKLDILLGTQMLAKGLDFPNVTLVGIVDADLSLHIPDFRAAERTFQLLVQVAGRAGRGDRAGEVFVQTFTPEAAPIQFAKRADYDDFAADELAQRREFGYPPERRLIRHLFRGRNQDKVRLYAETWTRRLAESIAADNAAAGAKANTATGSNNAPAAEPLLEIRGPVPCALERLQDQFRWHACYFTRRVTAAVARIVQLRREFTFDPDIADILDVDAIDAA